MSRNSSFKIVFYDGECIFCNRSVQFILKYSKNDKLMFASLQGVKAQKYLSTRELKEKDSVIVFTEKMKFYKSDAVVEIAKDLILPFSFLRVINILPKQLRDLAYDFFAKNRYRWFGKYDHCIIPDQTQKDRFLD